MKSARGLLRGGIAAVGMAFLAALVSCRTTKPPQDTAGLSAPRLVQFAQAAADAEDYELAVSYYKTLQERFPEDTEHRLWASYEIAFLQHKMGDDDEAVRLFDELIASYESSADAKTPQGPRILAEKVKANILSSTKAK